ncbi:helix-turn-helix domain-containing protein [Myxococcus faecalis]|uniref:helix-turn-helix domain-containing protein n=2 Tax=Myxococcus faecalis TaxID=3115646 RepID=UPI0024C90ED4|nr:helix-turn-helix domain-containing protein [Myxococcus sp. MH1]BDT31738.1 helix-turn-helix domain-containing protein [Myxococcus sp. MH1]BDT32979.1 helix-turn-helix domain-containing protein [Myxococcus sp. MH1]BDT33954.1 helix-turn-helix domain-containing protein [Myxococcus sp. MH1]BDT35933.1 helix-turn-helix domain-containing protein [Myxococcus sp. MH1]
MRIFWTMRPARSPAELGLTAEDRRKLEHALRSVRDARHFRRLLAVRLLAEGKGPGEAAHLAALSRPAVYFWLERYLAQRDPEALRDAPRQGRPRNAPRLTAERLREVVRGSPEKQSWASHGWTVPLLCTHLKRQGIEVSPRTLRRRLHEAGLAWKRPRYVYATAAPHPGQKKGALSAV